MENNRRSWAKGCGILAAVLVGVPLLIVAVVGVQTWAPLHEAGETLADLDRSLGSGKSYVPAPSGAVPAERMERFLELRTRLVEACGDYGTVRRGFDSVADLETAEPGDTDQLGEAASGLGGAALSITPFLARYFELRNDALLAASMGLEEYAYIYGVAYHGQLLSRQTRDEIFSDGDAVSPEAAALLRDCLTRQLAAAPRSGSEGTYVAVLEAELESMAGDPQRLVWQDGLPEAVSAGIRPYRERLDRLFCGATAGLEMERDARRALRLALE